MDGNSEQETSACMMLFARFWSACALGISSALYAASIWLNSGRVKLKVEPIAPSAPRMRAPM